MTFTILIVSIEQNEEFQESRVHYTLAGIQSLLNIGEGGFLGMRGGKGVRKPWNPPLATPPTTTCETRRKTLASRFSHKVAEANERRLYSQARLTFAVCRINGVLTTGTQLKQQNSERVGRIRDAK